MCKECDAFLGKPHKEGCSKHGRLVEMGDATKKFTTIEHADAEDPMVSIDVETAELILRSLIPPEIADQDADKLKALRTGLEKFVASATPTEDKS